MKKLIFYLLAISCIFLVACEAEGELPEELPSELPVSGDPERPMYSDTTLLISVEEDFSDKQLKKLLKKYDLSVVYDYENFNMYALSTAEPISDEDMLSLIDALSNEDGIIYAERDGITYLDDPVLDNDIVLDDSLK